MRSNVMQQMRLLYNLFKKQLSSGISPARHPESGVAA